MIISAAVAGTAKKSAVLTEERYDPISAVESSRDAWADISGSMTVPMDMTVTPSTSSWSRSEKYI